MESTQLVDCAGRRRSPATLPGYHRGPRPATKNTEIVHAVQERPAPMISATNGLKLAH